MWFDVMRSYSDLGEFLAGFSMLGIVLYFVTSSDSGSLVIDCLASNGDPDPPAVQRVFWATMEGATATALLVAGGTEGKRQDIFLLSLGQEKVSLLFLFLTMWVKLVLCGLLISCTLFFKFFVEAVLYGWNG